MLRDRLRPEALEAPLTVFTLQQYVFSIGRLTHIRCQSAIFQHSHLLNRVAPIPAGNKQFGTEPTHEIEHWLKLAVHIADCEYPHPLKQSLSLIRYSQVRRLPSTLQALRQPSIKGSRISTLFRKNHQLVRTYRDRVSLGNISDIGKKFIVRTEVVVEHDPETVYRGDAGI